MCFRPADASSDKKCPKCGETCQSTVVVCPKCGEKLPQSETPAAPRTPGAPGAPAVPGSPKPPGQ